MIASQLFGQNLDRDLASQAAVPGPIDFAHAPRTERRQNFAITELRPGRDRHSRNYIRYTTANRFCLNALELLFVVPFRA